MSREVIAGETIRLYIEIYDIDPTGNKVLKNADSLPVVSIYDPLHDPRDTSTTSGDATVYRANSTLLSTGIYYYDYTSPSGVITNYYFDVWEASIGGLTGSAVMQFLVVGTDAGATPLDYNYIVEVTIDSTVADTDGNTLESNYEFWFTTAFNPMYSDPTLLKLYVGNWITSIPDETLMLMLYESSKLADDITPTGKCQTSYFQNARSRFVTYDAALRLLSLPVNQGGMAKSLGDLFVKREGTAFIDLLDRLLKERDEWLRIVNAWDDLAPGESGAPIVAVKGQFDPDRPLIGRRWDYQLPGSQNIPGMNDKHIIYGRRLYSYYFNSNLGSASYRKEDIR